MTNNTLLLTSLGCRIPLSEIKATKK